MSLKKATFSERIKTALKMNGITQQELAEKTNINKGNMSRYVNGNANPKMDKIELMANVLGIDGAWLMGYDVPMHSGDYEDFHIGMENTCWPSIYERLYMNIDKLRNKINDGNIIFLDKLFASILEMKPEDLDKLVFYAEFIVKKTKEN